jgi:redox-sensitive bicupin YhaK (pirin superfamily)
VRVTGPDVLGALVYVARLQPGAEVVHRLDAGRAAQVYLVEGAASLDRDDVAAGDAAEVTDQPEVVIRAWQASELVLVDVPVAPPTAPQPGGRPPLTS